MKRKFVAVMAALTITASMVASCVSTKGAFSSGSSTASADSPQTGTAGNVLGSLLGGLIGNAVPVTEKSIVGTWTYQSPEVRFESEDFLSKAGGEVAAATIEQKLSDIYSKVGITPGNGGFIFNEDKTCTVSLGGRGINGTYSVNPDTHELKIQAGLLKLNAKVYFGAGNLAIIFDADKLLAVAQGLSAIAGKTSGKLAILSGALTKYKGLMLGMNLTKEK